MSIAINQISSFCQSYVVPKIVDNVLKSNALAYILFQKAKKWVGGTYFECPIKFAANSNAEAYTAGETLTIATVEQVTKAQYPAAQYNCAIALEVPSSLRAGCYLQDRHNDPRGHFKRRCRYLEIFFGA
jgi:hypothetical protein